MAADRDDWANSLSTESGSWVGNFLADEEPLDRRGRWRLASWGAGAVTALVVAMLANQTSVTWRRDQVAAADLMARQSQQIQSATRESQNEARRLASAIDTLNSDRDRLYSRVSSVEKNLDSMTGSIARQAAAPSAPQPQQTLPPTPVVAPVDSVASVDSARPKPQAPAAAAIAPALSPFALSKSMMAPPDPSATRLSEPPAPAAPDTTASIPQPDTASSAAELPSIAVQRTEFGLDLGTANTVDGLRALWRGLTASNKALTGLRPIIMVKERANGSGMQLRLVAGPVGDAAAAAKLCAALTESVRGCETSVFDGQRLAVKNDMALTNSGTAAVAPPASTAPPTPTGASITARPAPRKRAGPRPQQQRVESDAKPEDPVPKPQSALSSFLGIRQ